MLDLLGLISIISHLHDVLSMQTIQNRSMGFKFHSVAISPTYGI